MSRETPAGVRRRGCPGCGRAASDAGLRDAIEDGHVAGPRLLVSLAQLCGTGGIGDHFRSDIGEDHDALGSPHLPRGVFDGLLRGAVGIDLDG